MEATSTACIMDAVLGNNVAVAGEMACSCPGKAEVSAFLRMAGEEACSNKLVAVVESTTITVAPTMVQVVVSTEAHFHQHLS